MGLGHTALPMGMLALDQGVISLQETSPQLRNLAYSLGDQEMQDWDEWRSDSRPLLSQGAAFSLGYSGSFAMTGKIGLIVHYFQLGQHMWGQWTLALLLPACLVQGLSFIWFRTDGHKEFWSLTIVHLLQLGIQKRHWDILCGARGKGPPTNGDLVLKQGDLAVLRLLEALLQALPHLLLQTYIYLAAEQSDAFPAVSAGLSLLSLSWSLVSYNRFTCLMKPGHLHMPLAALLCQLLWRLGMLGARIVALIVFTRVHHFWIFAVGGMHWLVMSFWLVAQQTDIISQPFHWKLFNIILGAIYVFCYINFKTSPSRYRVTIFYMVMLIENVSLLLLATDFEQGMLWNEMWVNSIVMSGFIIGGAALIIYYSLLHPKSNEIAHCFRRKQLGQVCKEASHGCDLQSVNQSEHNEASGVVCAKSHGAHAPASGVDPEGLVTWIDTHDNHHHWLLLKLALKTGNVSKINSAFGDSGFGDIFPHRWLECKPANTGHVLIENYLSSIQNCHVVPNFDSVTENCKGKKIKAVDICESSSYVSLESGKCEDIKCFNTLSAIRGKHDATDIWTSKVDNYMVNGVKDGTTAVFTEGKFGAADSLAIQPRGAEKCGSSTLYYSINTEEMVSSNEDTGAVQQVNKVVLILEDDKHLARHSNMHDIKDEIVQVTCMSPITNSGSNNNFRRSIVLGLASQYEESTSSTDTSEFMENEGVFRMPYKNFMTTGMAAAMAGRDRLEEDPCFTSTPKPEPISQELELRKSKARKKLCQLTDRNVRE
uniref:XK-related protein n=1 Tax=Geotrypetes seraphini TaxID=260995 RepID=A0A6P8R471_GEOSA|nr:XK-related protein 5 [Geotrypetes seraphini]